MPKPSESKYDKGRQELSLTSMFFNRYLLIRYTTEAFFFANLYWFFLSFSAVGLAKWWPFTLILTTAAIAVEQVSKYWRRDNKLPVTKVGYAGQLLSNFLALVVIVTGHGASIFPFFGQKGISLITTVLLIGLGICFYILARVHLIETNRDRYLKRIRQFAQSLQ